MDISIVVPVFNEEESLSELREWIEKVLSAHSYQYEVIMVDDESLNFFSYPSLVPSGK